MIKSFHYIIYGESNTGKTFLCNRISGIDMSLNLLQPSIGVEIFNTECHYTTPKRLQFWDLSGDKEYYNIVKRYFELSNNLILTYDTRRITSFYFLKRALHLINTEGKEIILLGTKYNSRKHDTGFDWEVDEYASIQNYKHYKVDSLDDCSIDDFLKKLNNLIDEKMESEVGCCCTIL